MTVLMNTKITQFHFLKLYFQISIQSEKKFKNQNLRQSNTTMLGGEEDINPTAFIFCLSAEFHIHVRHFFPAEVAVLPSPCSVKK